jgi:hypothetical protein
MEWSGVGGESLPVSESYRRPIHTDAAKAQEERLKASHEARSVRARST